VSAAALLQLTDDTTTFLPLVVTPSSYSSS
jgi:hypothetical protein